MPLADRVAKYTFLGLEKTVDAISSTMIRLMGSGNVPVHTLTADNGKEFADHSRVTKALEEKIYFSSPHYSRERGLNERTNGSVPEYFPNGSGLLQGTRAKRFRRYRSGSTRTPRKVKGYRTPPRDNVRFRTESALIIGVKNPSQHRASSSLCRATTNCGLKLTTALNTVDFEEADVVSMWNQGL